MKNIKISLTPFSFGCISRWKVSLIEFQRVCFVKKKYSTRDKNNFTSWICKWTPWKGQGMKTLLTLYPYFIVTLFYCILILCRGGLCNTVPIIWFNLSSLCVSYRGEFWRLTHWLLHARVLQLCLLQVPNNTIQSRGRILGRNWNKSLKSFPPCYAQSLN
jgi:hypothetical protein